jgi:hypothetical protein
MSTNQARYFSQMWLDGHAKGDTINGGLWVPEGKETLEFKWVGRRDQADLTGTWEWPGSSNAPVQLKIERHDGRLTATYTDQNRDASALVRDNKPIPVTDLYDFGGGFYFTLLLGLEGNSMTHGSRRAGPEDGWLVGEAVAHEGTLGGTIAFYPYSERGMGLPAMGRVPQADKKPALQLGRREWQPKRIAP